MMAVALRGQGFQYLVAGAFSSTISIQKGTQSLLFFIFILVF